MVAWGEAPKRCSTFLGGFSHKIIITSTTPIVTPEFSSDLERAPGARSIADENSGVTFGVVELRRCEAYEHFRSHPVLLGTLPQRPRLSSPQTSKIGGSGDRGASIQAQSIHQGGGYNSCCRLDRCISEACAEVKRPGGLVGAEVRGGSRYEAPCRWNPTGQERKAQRVSKRQHKQRLSGRGNNEGKTS